MPVNANTQFTFTSYVITDTGVNLTFLAFNPGPDLDSYYTIVFTDAEIAAIGNLAKFQTAVITKLQRKVRGAGISTRLDGLIGSSVTI